jgi:hypothetical protein
MHVEKVWRQQKGTNARALPEDKAGRTLAGCYFDLRGRAGMLPVRGLLPCNGRASVRDAAGLDAGLAPFVGACRFAGTVSLFAASLGEGLFPVFAVGRVPDAALGFVPGFAPVVGLDFIQGCLLPPDFDMPGFWGRAILTTISLSTR